MGKRTSPASSRVKYQFKIGNNNFVANLKITTGNYLGLKKLEDLPKGKGKSTKRGVKGTKSFVLVLKNAQTIDGVRVQRLSFPVEGGVNLREFYAYAKKTFTGKGVAAIITPDGIQHAWDKIDRPKGGLKLPGLPNLPTLPGIDLSDIVSPEVGATVGGYLGGALGGTTGAGVGSALGGYLAGYI